MAPCRRHMAKMNLAKMYLAELIPARARRAHAWAPLRLNESWIALAAVTALFEVVAVGYGVSFTIAGVPVSPALAPGALLATLIGWRSLGVSADRLRVWKEFLLAGTALIGGLVLLFVHRLHWAGGVASIVVAATEEELLFRLALPVAVGAVVAAALGREPGRLSTWGSVPRFAAVSTAAVVFAVMPGHLMQVAGDSAAGVVPFLGLGLLLTYVVLRTGDLIPGLVLHVLLNLATFAYAYGGIDHATWAALIIAGVALFGWSAERVGRRDATPLQLAPATAPGAPPGWACRTPEARGPTPCSACGPHPMREPRMPSGPG